MGIPIGGKQRRRRSYADYKPPSRKKKPRDDPFRVVFYLVLIAGVLWVYFNQEFVMGRISAQLEDAAVADITKPTTTPTPRPDDYAVLGEEAYLKGKLAEAVEYYRLAASYAPNTVEYHVQVARMLLFQTAMQYGEQREATLQEALEAANGAILASPERPEGHAIYGKILDWYGRPEDAASPILRALEIDENYALAHSYMAEVLTDLDQWDRAIETIELALSLDPNSVDIRRDYAYILESLGDYAAAATQYEAALALHPKLPYLRVALGRDYRVLGRYQEALDQFFEIEAVEPQNALIPFEVGRTYETYIGDPNSALEFYERAVELDENYVSPWIRIGAIQYLQGNYSQAVIALERALALGAESVDIYYQLGLAYANQGRCDEALRYLSEAENRAEGDERILDIVESGIELCSQPTSTPQPTFDAGDSSP